MPKVNKEVKDLPSVSVETKILPKELKIDRVFAEGMSLRGSGLNSAAILSLEDAALIDGSTVRRTFMEIYITPIQVEFLRTTFNKRYTENKK